MRKLKLTVFEGPRSGDNGVLGVSLSEALSNDFCTHIVAQADNPFRQTMFWGDYFRTKEEAEQDYQKRVNHLVKNGYVIKQEIK